MDKTITKEIKEDKQKEKEDKRLVDVGFVVD